MNHPETMKVQPWGEGQGDFVVINREDFDPAKHTPLEGEERPMFFATGGPVAPSVALMGEGGPAIEPLAVPTHGFEVVPAPQEPGQPAADPVEGDHTADPLTAAQVAALDRDHDGAAGGSENAPAPILAEGSSLPTNWRDLHWKQREKIARDLGAQPAEGETLTPAAVTAFLEAFEAQVTAAQATGDQPQG